MSDGDASVTDWLQAVSTGDEKAATHLWDRYFHRLVGLARKRLVQDAEYDDEDLAASVFATFWKSQQDGRYEVNDRDDFWSLLVVMTMRKANDQRKRVHAAKRKAPGDRNVDPHLAPAIESDPELHAIMAEQCEDLLNSLADPELQQVALLKLDGHTNQEIANRIDCGLRSVGRMLQLIRKIWEGEDKTPPSE